MTQPVSRSQLTRKWVDEFARCGRISYEIAGKTAMFSDPTTSVGGEKISMEIPSYGAVKCITKNIFWKPAIDIKILRVRVMNPIRMTGEGVLMLGLNGERDRTYHTYLQNVKYQVEFTLDFNYHHPEFASQWGNLQKYLNEFVRAIIAEGRHEPFLGKSECVPAYIRPCRFGEGEGYYDHSGTKSFGYLKWGLTYPDEAYDNETEGCITDHIWPAEMVDGIVTYPAPGDCLRRKIRDAEITYFPDRTKGGKNADI